MTTLAAYRDLLRNGRLVRLLVGEFISSIGDWLYLVALLIVVYRSSTDPVLLGIVGAARVLPYVILSVPAGFVADRFDRRLVLIVTDIARGVIMLALGWLVSVDGPLWAIVALSIAATCFSAFFGPTIGSFLPSLVSDEAELGPANSAWSSLDNLAFVIGPAVGGLLIAASSLAFAFFLNAASFAFVATMLWRLPSGSGIAERERPAQTGDSAEPGSNQIGEPDRVPLTGGEQPGLTFRSLLRPVAALALVDIVGGFVFGGLSILTVVLATSSFGSGDEATGYLNAAIGLGGVLGAIGSGALVLRPRLGPPLLLGALGLGIGLAALGAVNSLAPALVAITVASGGDLVLEVVSTTIFQRVVPDEIRGRALGGVATLTTLSYAAGSLSLPILASGVGTAVTLAGAGIAIIAATVAAVVLLGPTANRTDSAETATLRRVARLPLFAGTAPARLEAALHDVVRMPVAPGTVVIREGDAADRFYIIESGTYEVTQRSAEEPGGQRVLRELGADDVFGEIGLLTAAPRTASVTARSSGILLSMGGPAFLELVGTGPGLASRLLDLHRGAATPRAGTQATSELSGT